MEGVAKNEENGHCMYITLGEDEAEEMMDNGVSKCSGSCCCVIEPDGTCPLGWPSVMLAVGLV